MSKLLSGAHASLNLQLINTWIDKSTIQRENTVTFQSTMQLIQSELTFEKVA
jgi:hypothetical protein